MNVYLFGWPGMMGGASTKFAHLIGLLHRHHSVTVVSLDPNDFSDSDWLRWLDERRFHYCAFEELPRRLRGWGVSLCNSDFLGTPRWVDLRRRGLKLAWGNEMMGMLAEEAGAITLGQVDAVLYVSPVQRAALEPHYQRLLCGALETEPVKVSGRSSSGWIRGNSPKDRIRWVMVGNYVDPTAFPFQQRTESKARLTVGRLSRPDPYKFPADFPDSYERLGLKSPKFRVMAWSDALQERWCSHAFDDRWDLLESSPDVVEFLQSLDLFVYELGVGCRESWGRAVVEAMLTGAVPLIPRGGGHHLENLIEHGKAGFLCRNRREFSHYARYLQDRPSVRLAMARNCRETAVRRHCNVRSHLLRWDELFHGC